MTDRLGTRKPIHLDHFLLSAPIYHIPRVGATGRNSRGFDHSVFSLPVVAGPHGSLIFSILFVCRVSRPFLRCSRSCPVSPSAAEAMPASLDSSRPIMAPSVSHCQFRRPVLLLPATPCAHVQASSLTHARRGHRSATVPTAPRRLSRRPSGPPTRPTPRSATLRRASIVVRPSASPIPSTMTGHGANS